MNSSETGNVSKSVITSITTSGHPINGCVKWSQNNWIAIVVNKYIYVLSSRTDPTEWTQPFPYHKSLIPNPKEPMAFECGFSVRKVISLSPLDEQQLLMTDPTLAGQTANSPTFLSYKLIDWSPICQQFGCLLGGLTLDSRLVIYRKDVYDWEQTLDLSTLLNENLKELWTDTEKPDYDLYRDRMYSLATNAFCWAQNWFQTPGSEPNGITCKLYMGSKNGLITFWDINCGSDREMSAQMVYKWESGFDQINCMKSFDDFLIISSFNGLVSVMFSRFSMDSTPNPLALWSEADGIGVNDFAVKAIDNDIYDIVFTKSDFIIICRFSSDSNGEDITLSLKCCKTLLGLHRMPSTAICSTVESKYLLTSMDGQLIEIQVSHDLSVTQSEVTLDSVSCSAMCAHGVHCSPNGMLSALVQSLTPFHDHLVIKEPVQVVVFSNISFDYLTNVLFEKYLCENPIASNDQLIANCFDYFDCIRSFLSNTQYSTFDTFLFTLIDNQNLIIECNDLVKLRIIRFITRAYITHSKGKSDPIYHRLEANALLCEDMILKLSIEELYTGVVCGLESLNECQLRSLKNMNLWLSRRFSTQLFADNCFDLNSILELCPICQQPIEFENRSTGLCPQSHHFQRCTNSLVLCDFLNYKSEKCFRCFKSLVMKPSVWNQTSICLYCG